MAIKSERTAAHFQWIRRSGKRLLVSQQHAPDSALAGRARRNMLPIVQARSEDLFR